MNAAAILQEVEARIQRLKQARELLNGGIVPSSGNGFRPDQTGTMTKQKDGQPRRILSEEARQRIVAAQKRRWAAHRKATKKGTSDLAAIV